MGKVSEERLIEEEGFIRRGADFPSRSSHWRNMLIVLTLINLAACATTCICTGFCYTTTLTKASIPESSTVKPDVGTTEPTYSPEDFREYVVIDDADSVEYMDSYEYDYDGELDEYYDDEESDSDEYDDNSENYEDDSVDYDDESTDYNYDADDEDSALESSGNMSSEIELEIEQNSSDKDLVEKSNDRTRRSAPKKDCATKCKGKNSRCLKKCMKSKDKNRKRGAKPINLPAAHFEAYISDEDLKNAVGGQYNSYEPTEVCKFIHKLEGILCLNRTFIPREKHEPLRIFKKSSWYNEEKAPVHFKNSVLSAKTGGIFLVYAQAYIMGREPKKSISIVQKRQGLEISKLSCDNGVNAKLGDAPQLQTCAITGLMNLQALDTLEIQTMEQEENIMVQKDMTYFGLVKLGGANENNKIRGNNRRH